MDKVSDDQIIQKFVKHCVRQGRSEKTIVTYSNTVEFFRRFLNKKRRHLVDIDGMENKDLLEAFIDHLRDNGVRSFSRFNVCFSALNHLYSYLEYDGVIKQNIVLTVRKMNLTSYKKGAAPSKRKIIDVEKMSRFLNSIINLEDKTICTVLVKTGLRRDELVSLDVDEIKFEDNSITLKGDGRFYKRTNLKVYFDEETERLLKRWLARRKMIVKQGEPALFVSESGHRLHDEAIASRIAKWAVQFGIHDKKSERLEDHFTAHNFRHCFTTYLRQAGMSREYIGELRGDKPKEVFDIYYHIDHRDLRKSYLSSIPKFNVY